MAETEADGHGGSLSGLGCPGSAASYARHGAASRGDEEETEATRDSAEDGEGGGRKDEGDEEVSEGQGEQDGDEEEEEEEEREDVADGYTAYDAAPVTYRDALLRGTSDSWSAFDLKDKFRTLLHRVRRESPRVTVMHDALQAALDAFAELPLDDQLWCLEPEGFWAFCASTEVLVWRSAPRAPAAPQSPVLLERFSLYPAKVPRGRGRGMAPQVRPRADEGLPWDTGAPATKRGVGSWEAEAEEAEVAVAAEAEVGPEAEGWGGAWGVGLWDVERDEADVEAEAEAEAWGDVGRGEEATTEAEARGKWERYGAYLARKAEGKAARRRIQSRKARPTPSWARGSSDPWKRLLCTERALCRARVYGVPHRLRHRREFPRWNWRCTADWTV